MWGYLTQHFDDAIVVSKPVISQAAHHVILASECPIAIRHLHQALRIAGRNDIAVMHPVELLAQGLLQDKDSIQLTQTGKAP